MAKENIYEYDYQKGIATQKENAFIEVMQTQSNYDFLKHKEIIESTAEQKKIILDNINKRITRLTEQAKQRIQSVVIAIMMIFAIGLTSCDKQEQPIVEREIITQELKLKNIYSMPMTKGFDPSTWVYEYNTEPFELTFTNLSNPSESITRSVTIAQLQAGINVNIFSGTYNITYQTTTNNITKCDIKINMENVIIDGTPIELSATYDDYLVVFDVPSILAVSDVYFGGKSSGTILFTFTKHADGFVYAYFNNRDYYYDSDSAMWYYTNTAHIPAYKVFLPVETFKYGNVYWYTAPIGASTQITFPNWDVNKITVQ